MKIRRNTLELLKHYHRSNNPDALLRSSSRLQIESPNSIVARIYTARALVMNSQYIQAAEIFESILIPFPRLRKVYLEYLDCLWLGGRRSIFEVQSFRFLEFHFSGRICFRLGYWLIKQKEWSKALRSFLRLRAEKEGTLSLKSSVSLRSILGKIYFNLGDFKQALIEFNGVNTSTAHYYRAKIFADQGRAGMALQQLEKIVDFHLNEKVLRFTCQLQKELGMSEAEQLTLSRLFKIESVPVRRLKILDRLEFVSELLDDQHGLIKVLNTKARMGVCGSNEIKKMAEVYWNQDKVAKACEKYEQLLKINPFDEEALIRLTGYYRRCGDNRRAYQLLKAYYLSNQATQGAQLEYAECALTLDKVSEGRDVLLNLLERGQENGRIYFLLWKIYANQQRYTAARYYKKLFENLRAA